MIAVERNVGNFFMDPCALVILSFSTLWRKSLPKWGNPEEYQAAMDYFRALGDEELFKTFGEIVRKNEDWNQENRAPFSKIPKCVFLSQ